MGGKAAGSQRGKGAEGSPPTRWWHDLRRFDEERIDAAIEQVEVECRSRAQGRQDGWPATVEELLKNARSHRGKSEFDAAWNAIKAAHRELVSAFDRPELTVEATRVRREADAKLHGWRKQAVQDALPDARQPDWPLGKPPTPRSPSGSSSRDGTEEDDERQSDACDLDQVEDLRRRVKVARQIVDDHMDNVYRRLRLLRGHLVRSVGVLLAVLAITLAIVASPLAADTGSDLRPIDDAASLVVVMVLGALGAAVSGTLTLLAEEADRRIPDVRAQRSLIWARPLVGAGAAIVVVEVLRSGLAGVTVEPHAMVAIALVAGFSERLVSRAVAAASSSFTR